MQCLSTGVNYCRRHQAGYSLYEKGCPENQICSECQQGNVTHPTVCHCENKPFTLEVKYGEECNSGKICGKGEGICYMPCDQYLHSTQCPKSHCKWSTQTLKCISQTRQMRLMRWSELETPDSILVQAAAFVDNMRVEAYPLDFTDLGHLALGFRVQGNILSNITDLETVFLQLDLDNDGFLNHTEYTMLPNVLNRVSVALTKAKQEAINVEASARRLDAEEAEEHARRLQNGTWQGSPVTAEVCGAQVPRKYYCSFDISCKTKCQECGWKSATDEAYSMCVRPTPTACRADNRKIYCKSDDLCHPAGNCTDCVDRPTVDFAQSMCLATWWGEKPLTHWTNWVCRDRNKVGMPCRADQDCIYGLRKCMYGKCLSKQPYNPNMKCDSDYDCPHIGFYCPVDPTGGINPYWIQYCRKQREEGMTCADDRECMPEARCNKAEPQPRCRRLFSLIEGSLASDDTFCEHGWRDMNDKCASPAKSKRASRPCDMDKNCVTTDATMRPGRCVCKAWWDKDESKYCEPVAGDYENHQEALRNFIWFRAKNCGSFWTEEQCMQVFGDSFRFLKLAYECEKQELSGGPYLPPYDCGVVDYDRFPDYCSSTNSNTEMYQTRRRRTR
jgi:hypothetical protein